jgi:hypothetical protein
VTLIIWQIGKVPRLGPRHYLGGISTISMLRHTSIGDRITQLRHLRENSRITTCSPCLEYMRLAKWFLVINQKLLTRWWWSLCSMESFYTSDWVI